MSDQPIAEHQTQKITKAMTDMTFYPTILDEEDFPKESYTKIPLSGIAMLGVGFDPLAKCNSRLFLK